MGTHGVQSVGDLSFALIHPLVNGGASTTLTGFKMEGDILNSAQLMENAKVVPLIGGNSVTITNNNRSGKITFSCIKHTDDPMKGDITAIANELLKIGDNSGGTLRCSFGMNGKNFSRTFLAVCLCTAPPLKIAGNDLPDYGIEFTYADYM